MNTDDLLRKYYEQINMEEQEPSILNPVRVREFQEALEIVNKLFADDGRTTITYQIHQPYASMGYIKIAGAELMLTDPQEFHRAVSLASNFSVTPMLDGTVYATLTFHELTVHFQGEAEQ